MCSHFESYKICVILEEEIPSLTLLCGEIIGNLWYVRYFIRDVKSGHCVQLRTTALNCIKLWLAMLVDVSQQGLLYYVIPWSYVFLSSMYAFILWTVFVICVFISYSMPLFSVSSNFIIYDIGDGNTFLASC